MAQGGWAVGARSLVEREAGPGRQGSTPSGSGKAEPCHVSGQGMCPSGPRICSGTQGAGPVVPSRARAEVRGDRWWQALRTRERWLMCWAVLMAQETCVGSRLKWHQPAHPSCILLRCILLRSHDDICPGESQGVPTALGARPLVTLHEEVSNPD